MDIIVHIPEADKLAQSLDRLAAALGDKSAAALAREQKWNQGAAELQHPDEDPKTAQVAPVQQTAPAQPLPTAAPAQQTSTAPSTATNPLPTTTKQYSLDDLAKAAGQLMDSGKQNDLISLLNNQFKIQALTQLPPKQFGTFATALRGLGAQI